MHTWAGSKTNRIVVFVVTAVAAVAGLALTPPRAAAEPRSASRTAAFAAALNPGFNLLATSPAGFGYLPSPLSPVTVAPSARTLATRDLSAGFAAASYPSHYDLRAHGRVTAVRDQGPFGTCWTFATFGSLESTLLPTERRDFSEDNLALQSGFDWQGYGGGNDQMAAAYLLRWSGPVDESSDAYGDSLTPPGLTPVKHVQSWVRLPQPSSPRSLNLVKGAIVRYGALYAVIHYAAGSYKSRTHAYYYSGTSLPNHAIDIIGWNDNYAATNFSHRPPRNGAFLCRNSWGRSWGAQGYFWVSYYDKFIESSMSAFPQVQKATNYARCYQYDPFGQTDSIGWQGKIYGCFANQFTATADGTLAAVGIGVTSGNAYFAVYAGPSFSQLSYVANGSSAFAGFTTVKASVPMALTSGSSFVVAVVMNTPQCDYPVPVEEPIPSYDSSATAAPGQSFVSSDGCAWTDLTTIPGYANCNVCLKAYTTN